MIFDFPKKLALETALKANKSLILEELFDSPKALLISLAASITGKTVVVISSGVHEEHLFDDLPFFTQAKVIEFPAWETLPSENVSPSPDVVGMRYQAIDAIERGNKPPIILTTLPAVLQKLLPRSRLKSLHLTFKVGEELDFENLPHHLSEMGYHRQSVAADKGEFAVRGGIIDIFPVSLPEPYRIEFLDDEIVSMRTYDPVGQTSVEKVSEIVLTPGEESELLQEEKELATLFDFLEKDFLVVFDGLTELEEKAVSLKKEHSHSFSSFEALFSSLLPVQKLFITELPLEKLTEVKSLVQNEILFNFFDQELKAHRWRPSFSAVRPAFCPPNVPLDAFSSSDFLEIVAKSNIPCTFVCQSASEKKALLHQLPSLKEESILDGYLSSGFFIEEPPMALIPMTEISARTRVRRQKQRTAYHSLPVEMFSLTPGEAVVHNQNGIGRYLGVEKRPNHLGVETEFLLLEYAGGSKLFVPIHQAHLVSKYIGASDEKPTFHTLGTSRWQKACERSERSIRGYAKDLLKVQAERALKKGIVYPPDSDLVSDFGKEFPYVETPDQKRAIDDIGMDLCSERLMDRLICGDVGYGKTEVAMRAAFKAVVDGGKQVALLVPTTVLAMQHFETFCARMANFPVRIGILSRFRTPKQIKQTLAEAAKGAIDILIGTHRIVSKDVLFKDLGLVIIDEEQRFGVKAKEHLKTIKSEIDCLTLSATPIPRTLYFSLIGAREMSVIATPPEDRLPIESLIVQRSDEMMKNALLRELNRDGQAYVIHNRVETIYNLADKLRTLIPEARLVVGHGQMKADELDLIFHAFKSGKANVLVATTIVENGIDVPNANTILIDRSDCFGMADLYQIRGRVGRWNRRAYCYFMVQNARILNPDARRRLHALATSSGHGGGMKIAMHDLEIRGAGNILGTEQSGHISQIGFGLYCKLLKKAIKQHQKGGASLLSAEVKIEFPYDARFPEHYVNEMSLRLDFYSRLGDAEEEKEIDLLFQEIQDRFGKAPDPVLWLFAITRLRLFAMRNHFTKLKLSKVIFEATQSHGKKGVMTKKILAKPPKTPDQLEPTLRKLLIANFPTCDIKLL